MYVTLITFFLWKLYETGTFSVRRKGVGPPGRGSMYKTLLSSPPPPPGYLFHLLTSEPWPQFFKSWIVLSTGFITIQLITQLVSLIHIQQT